MCIVDAIMFKDSHVEMDWMFRLLTTSVCGVQANRSQMYFYLFIYLLLFFLLCVVKNRARFQLKYYLQMQLILKCHKSGGVEQYNNCVVSCTITKKLLPILNKAKIAATKVSEVKMSSSDSSSQSTVLKQCLLTLKMLIITQKQFLFI